MHRKGDISFNGGDILMVKSFGTKKEKGDNSRD
jgi:hypothetical protein